MENLDSKESAILEQRKKKLLDLFKKTFAYILLAIVVFFAWTIRTKNLSKLRDITTGGWTLGPDLDPFLFLRWAKYIVENGSIMPIDTMRYVPLGFNTSEENVLLPYLIAWFHKIAHVFGSSSVEQSAALFPAVFFVLTVIAFFLMTKVMFKDLLGERNASILGAISSFFLTIFPVLLPRTIAGIPEKESVGFFFIFASFYCFVSAWKSNTPTKKYIFAFASGITTALMALVWGGYTYIVCAIGFSTFLLFLFGQVKKDKFFIYSIWLFVFLLITFTSISKYNLKDMIFNPVTGIAFYTLFILIVNEALFKTKIKNFIDKKEKISKIPQPFIALLVGVILILFLIIATQGFSFIFERISAVKNALVTPVSDRLGVTVAENKQPYFSEWESSFGPHWNDIAISFWLFFIGSIFLFYNLISHFPKKERLIFTGAYSFFLYALIFSRKSESSILNGTSPQSLLLYFSGFAVLIITLGVFYFKFYKKEELFQKIDAGALVLFAFFFLSLISARSAVRLVMVLVPSASILMCYLAISLFSNAKKEKSEVGKIVLWFSFGIVVLALLQTASSLYTESVNTASSYAPYSYTYQWQRAMAWVRENTSQNAVFGHWWDYGYWLQSIGQRATVLDGGNAIAYWDYLMGRYGLTNPDSDINTTLDFLYSHNTTHFLIDSTDIGKYAAFSSIGSDKNYDRRSWMQFFSRNKVINETKNSVIFFYSGGGFPLDWDVVFNQNGTLITLPEGKAVVAGFIIEINRTGFLASQPRAFYLYQKNKNTAPVQYILPLRYAYQRGKFIDFGSGVEAGVYFMPQLKQEGNTPFVDEDAVLIYLSNKTVKSNLVRLYLYKENNPYFKLVHSEDGDLVKQLKAYKLLKEDEDIVYAQGFVGPIRIWEIHYPNTVKYNPEYVQKNFPGENILASV